MFFVIRTPRKGVFDLEKKKILMEYGYAKISNWSCGETYFTLQVGSLVRASKLICETTLGMLSILQCPQCTPSANTFHQNF